MASYLFTPEQASLSALAVLKTLPVFAQTITRDFARDFTPGTGGVVMVKRPTIVDEANVYTDALRRAEARIEYTDLLQPHIPVELSDQIYQAVKLPDDVATFTLTDLETQVVAPMGESVAAKVEDIAFGVLDDVTPGLTAVDTAERGTLVHADGTAFASVNDYLAADPKARHLLGAGVGMTEAQASAFEAGLTPAETTDTALLVAIMSAKQVLDKRGVPARDRTLLVGTDWEFALTLSEKFHSADKSGSVNGLRNATIGNVFGFNVVVTSLIDPAAAYAYHRDFAALTTAVTSAPRGAAFSATKSVEGYTLRYLHDYDANTLRDRAVLDLFAGVDLLDHQRVLKLEVGAAA